MTETRVAIVGGGAAGIAAARVLHGAAIPYRLLEARSRLGGRAYTIDAPEQGYPIDLGCGWLHSADRNPWADVAADLNFTIDRTPPPWTRPSTPIDFPLARQQEFRLTLDAFYERMSQLVAEGNDAPASAALLPGDPWNGLIGAVATFITGADLDQVSAMDFDRYSDTMINWRVVEGYGHLIASSAAGLDVTLDCVVTAIDHSGSRLRIETSQGAIACDHAIVTIPTDCLAAGAVRFSPDLPDKLHTASRLPLGLNNKLFLALDGADDFEKDSRIFGRTDSAATAAYHMRPFGRPQIEGYFGGSLARELEAGADGSFFDFAREQLVQSLGNDFARRIRPLALHRWRRDPFSLGAYSYAMPGHALDRAKLAASVDGRIHFAGEACSEYEFSTAHGAYLTGVEVAQTVMASLTKR